MVSSEFVVVSDSEEIDESLIESIDDLNDEMDMDMMFQSATYCTKHMR